MSFHEAFSRSLSAAVLLLAATASPRAIAQQPTFPFMHESTARTAYVSGAYDKCMERLSASARKRGMSTPELGAFCICYGRAMADAITGAEFDAMTTNPNHLSESITKKGQGANKLCFGRMNPSDQGTERKRLVVALENQCRRAYHPEDTDAASTLVRETFCGCFAEEMTPRGKSDTARKSVDEVIDDCSRHLSPDNLKF